jgi:hypothetical protein
MLMLDNEIDMLDVELDHRLKNHAGYRNLLKVKGIGPVLAAIFVVEIGDVTRFKTAEQLACWAGITPRHYGPTGLCDRDIARRLHATTRVAKGCLAALAAVDLDIDSEADHNSTPHLPKVVAARVGSSGVCASLGWPQHRSSSLRCGRLRVDPTLARRCPKAADLVSQRSSVRGNAPGARPGGST